MQIHAMKAEELIAHANRLAVRIDNATERPTKWLEEFGLVTKRLRALGIDLASTVKCPENW